MTRESRNRILLKREDQKPFDYCTAHAPDEVARWNRDEPSKRPPVDRRCAGNTGGSRRDYDDTKGSRTRGRRRRSTGRKEETRPAREVHSRRNVTYPAQQMMGARDDAGPVNAG